MAKARRATTQLAIRLDDDTLQRIDEHAARLRELTPGVGVTRTDALRALLLEALSHQAEKNKNKPKK